MQLAKIIEIKKRDNYYIKEQVRVPIEGELEKFKICNFSNTTKH